MVAVRRSPSTLPLFLGDQRRPKPGHIVSQSVGPSCAHLTTALPTTITGAVEDPSALRGILSKIWDLNLTLVSVARFERDT